ncbi:MAG: helix-turn-helix transcriptional regulator [Eubacteriales bacterium]|nr:helix-turn-helix transcriptional regulator [Eubacteriales bacterium]
MADENSLEKVSLSRRQLDVLRLLAKGYTTPRIAEELGIGQNTVMDYRKHLHKKLKVNRVGELVFKATELHLI